MGSLEQKYKESIRLSYRHGYRLLMDLKNVIIASQKVAEEEELLKEVYRDSIVKKYEILEDLLWKLLSKIFKVSGLDLNNPRACYRQAFKEGWIENIDIWNEILSSRNTTAHVYNEEDYEKIKNKIIDEYMNELEILLNQIKSKVID